MSKTNLKLKASKFDEVYTPSGVVESLRKHLPKTMKTVWCPFDTADSNIVKDLATSGYTVISSHIKDGKDFFNWKPKEDYDIIVSNPSYSNKNEVIKRCNELKKPWALLLPLDVLCGTKRFNLTADAGVITIAHRIPFTGPANWFYNCWLCSWKEIANKWIKEL